jgi:hypothetical protein
MSSLKGRIIKNELVIIDYFFSNHDLPHPNPSPKMEEQDCSKLCFVEKMK